MTDGQFTLLFLIFFTAFEGIFRLPLETWLFQRNFVHFGRQLLPYFQAKGLGFGVSLPFCSPPLLCQLWPCVPTQDGVRLLASDGNSPFLVTWNKLDPKVEGSTLILSDGATCVMINHSMAKLWKLRLLEWKSQSNTERDSAFLKIAAASLTVEKARLQYQAIQESTRAMQWNSRLMSLVLFLYIPVTYYLEGDGGKVLSGLGVLYALMVLQAVFLRRFIKRYPIDGTQAFSRFLGCFVFPPTAIRLPDWAAVQMAGEVHPLAAHWAWSSKETTLLLAQKLFREARWPIGSKSTTPWQGADVVALQKFMEEHGIPLEADQNISREPHQTKQCPRCLTAYYSQSATCKDCEGIPLQSINKELVETKKAERVAQL